MNFSPFCLSSCLAFRYVAKLDAAWYGDYRPVFPKAPEGVQRAVRTCAQIEQSLRSSLAELDGRKDVGILLSGGMDSAILAALLPKGTAAYTIRFDAPGAVDESLYAKRYAAACSLQHQVVSVTWDDYLRHSDSLMLRKRAPLHAVEIALLLAAQKAKQDGINTLVVGNGADSTFGGLDKLLSRDWSFDDFVNRYTFIRPELCLCDPEDIVSVYEPYRRGTGIDVMQFLKVVHGLGIIQAFDNAIQAGGCTTVEPFEQIQLEGGLDMQRIRNGESKYLLRELFQKLYPNLEIPIKVAFARPMDQWLRDWQGPLLPQFRADIPLSQFTGDQKWLVWSLNRFLTLLESGAA